MKMSLLAVVLYLQYCVMTLHAAGRSAAHKNKPNRVYNRLLQAIHVRVEEAPAHSKPFKDVKQANQAKEIKGLKAVPRGYIILLIGVGVVLTLIAGVIYHYIKKWRKERQRRRYFIRNGGSILSNRSSRCATGNGSFKLFTEKEIEDATANYSRERILGHGSQGTVYKGMLQDGLVVAMKRAKRVDRSQLIDFMNEVVILSTIDHPNVVRLYGFCLEIDQPVLVYEYICRGSLFFLLHLKRDEFLNSWEARKRILQEVARALKHIHSVSSEDASGIFHRDIKSGNVLIDGDYRAILADFGLAKMVPLDRNHVSNYGTGSIGYMDPELVQATKYTDKHDIYSFGVLMAEVLSGERGLSDHDGVGLAEHFWRCLKRREWSRILDPRIRREDNEAELRQFAHVAKECLRRKREERPNMEQVVEALEGTLSLI